METSTLEKFFSLKVMFIATTLLIAVAVGFVGGMVDIMQTQNVVQIAQHLGYPLYFFTLLGIFKILGGVVLLLPQKFNRIKELAYFGFFVDFIFASFSHYSVQDSAFDIIMPLGLLVVLLVSFILSSRYCLYKKSA